MKRREFIGVGVAVSVAGLIGGIAPAEACNSGGRAGAEDEARFLALPLEIVARTMSGKIQVFNIDPRHPAPVTITIGTRPLTLLFENPGIEWVSMKVLDDPQSRDSADADAQSFAGRGGVQIFEQYGVFVVVG